MIGILTMVALLRMRVLHGNGLGLGLLLLHLLVLLGLMCLGLCLCHGRRIRVLLLVRHLLLLLLNLEMWRQVDKWLSAHLLSHGCHLCGVHVLHLVRETHAHALLLRKHCLLLLSVHESLLLGASLVLQHLGVH